jgi:hypothetical protein
MTEINGLSVYEPRDPLPFTVRVFDADGNEIPTSGRRCTEPDCQRPLADGLICHVCHERLKLVGELNDLRLELITRNDEIAALVAALRNLDKAIDTYFASTYGSAREVAQAQMAARKVLRGDHSTGKDEMVNEPPTDN